MTSPGLQLTPDARHDLPGDGADASHATRAEMLAELDGLVAMYRRYGNTGRVLLAIRNLIAAHPAAYSPGGSGDDAGSVVSPAEPALNVGRG